VLLLPHLRCHRVQPAKIFAQAWTLVILHILCHVCKQFVRFQPSDKQDTHRRWRNLSDECASWQAQRTSAKSDMNIELGLIKRPVLRTLANSLFETAEWLSQKRITTTIKWNNYLRTYFVIITNRSTFKQSTKVNVQIEEDVGRNASMATTLGALKCREIASTRR
jgi:hypothetical protein